MYNIRILIQEIQLLRGPFRIYVLIAHGSAPLGTATKTGQVGRWVTEHQATAAGALWPASSYYYLSRPGGHFIAGWDFV